MLDTRSRGGAPDDVNLARGPLVDRLRHLTLSVTSIEVSIGTLIGFLTWPVAHGPATTGIDPSWIVGLHLAERHGMPFGDAILWTFGPLGFLGYAQPYLGTTSALALGFVGALHVAACIAMVSLMRPAVGVAAAAAVAAAIAFTMPWLAGWTLFGVMVFMASAHAVLRRADHPSDLPLAIGLGVIVGIGLLGKLNIGLVSLAVGAVGVAASARVPRRSLLAYGAAAAVSFLAAWFASGQGLAELPTYVRGTYEITVGYGAAMGQLDPQAEWGIGLALIATLMLGGIVWLRTQDLARRDRVALWILVALIAFASFKAGFTRQGVGIVIYLATVLALIPAVVPQRLPGLVVAMPVAGVVGMILALAALPLGALFDPVDRVAAMVQGARTVLIDRGRAVADTGASLRAQYGLPPEAVTELDGHTVDIEPWEAAAAHAYPELSWRPLPVFQSYQAYTPWLDQLNARFLAASDAPERILWLTPPGVPLSIDGRTMWFDAPGARIEMLCRYVPVATDVGWQVLARVDDRCGTPVHVASVGTTAGATVEVPGDLPPGILTVTVSGIGDDPVTKVVTLAYRAPAWFMDTGEAMYRVPLGIDGEAAVIAATTDTGWMAPLAPGEPPGSLSVAPEAGAPGADSPLTVTFEVIPIVGSADPAAP